MAQYLVTDTELTAIADAIRAKGGTAEPLIYPNGFVSAIQSIPQGGTVRIIDTPDGHGGTIREITATTIVYEGSE